MGSAQTIAKHRTHRSNALLLSTNTSCSHTLT